MPENKPKIAAIQLASGPNVGANLLETERLVAEAVEAEAQLVALPENFSFMGKQEQDLISVAESSGNGPLQDFLSQIARKYKIWIVGGTIPIKTANSDLVRSACILFDDHGQQVARYDKIHLFDVHLIDAGEKYMESAAIEPGNQVVVADTPFGRLGLAVCYDLRFPELFRAMLDQGLNIIALPASFTAITGKAHWELLIRTRAIENLSFVVAAAQGGYHISGRQTHGHSMIVSPWGSILAEVNKGTGMIVSHIEPGCQDNMRRNFPALTHRKIKCSI
ncbi:acyltransferase [Achromatium sp. WMS2]|nr:acyltransferase [Achromatium sp. WMS2]